MKIELDLENSEINVVIFYPNEKTFWLKKNAFFMRCAPKAFISGVNAPYFFHSPFSVLLIYLSSGDCPRGERKKSRDVPLKI